MQRQKQEYKDGNASFWKICAGISIEMHMPAADPVIAPHMHAKQHGTSPKRVH